MQHSNNKKFSLFVKQIFNQNSKWLKKTSSRQWKCRWWQESKFWLVSWWTLSVFAASVFLNQFYAFFPPFSLSFQIFLLASLSFFLPLFWTIFSSISSFTFELPNVGDCLPWWVTQPPQVIYLDQKLPVLNKNNRVQPNSTNSEHHF